MVSHQSAADSGVVWVVAVVVCSTKYHCLLRNGHKTWSNHGQSILELLNSPKIIHSSMKASHQCPLITGNSSILLLKTENHRRKASVWGSGVKATSHLQNLKGSHKLKKEWPNDSNWKLLLSPYSVAKIPFLISRTHLRLLPTTWATPPETLIFIDLGEEINFKLSKWFYAFLSHCILTCPLPSPPK